MKAATLKDAVNHSRRCPVSLVRASRTAASASSMGEAPGAASLPRGS
jgi:hypothetical protein